MISTIRPVASDGTVRCRDTSGFTTPVTFSSGAATCSPAVASGNCSGCCTVKLLGSMSVSTCVGTGPVPDPTVSFAAAFSPQPVVDNVKLTHKTASSKMNLFIE